MLHWPDIRKGGELIQTGPMMSFSVSIPCCFGLTVTSVIQSIGSSVLLRLPVRALGRRLWRIARDALARSRPANGWELSLDAFVDRERECMRLAVSLYSLRRKRDAVAGTKGLFGEPGWDILLDLYIAERRRIEIQVSSVCLDAGVPSTTILRWIARLEADGLIYRVNDLADARRRFVRLTEQGQKIMHAVLCSMGNIAVD